jgi:hypothetical protein
MPQTEELNAALERMCERLGLDYEKVKTDLDAGKMLASVAVFGEEGAWPKAFIDTARREYAA